MSTESQPLSPLASNLRQWRERRGLSVSGLARDAGISKSTVSELERGNGNPSLDTLWALAKALNVSLGALFVDQGPVGETVFKRLVEAPTIARDGDEFIAQLVSAWRNSGEIEISVVTLAQDGKRDSRGNAAGVIERVVCMRGLVEVGPVGASVLLEPGDMLMFRADQPHIYHARGEGGRLLVVQQYPTDS
ncbi:helix-turn-helix domain-containing protein [Lysinibacter cavernae]|uniref:Transcriptional regulator with XRE-family HTH domain n=1 Tax=Lysinibacter cavernae TaxID=1640652 RepID=A0A7X5R3Q7_9MICO|nr:XRE family transcriptional regulator [Lysinibacter cavernae]NIH54785.1 transcriptional regulator with XRE-family HTH domain [Lysinibacter cavernae]